MPGVIAFRETTWMDRRADFRQWDHLCRSQRVDLQMLEPGDAVPVMPGLVIIDERGEIELEDFEHPEECTYLFGRTGMNDLLSSPHAYSVRIDTPEPICLFGVSAASMVLRDRKRKHDRHD